ncbi:MAG: GNAT family N-acetyltransferase [Spirochaetaceae bacterium]|nr:GNAT family N-acetyltransferase [Spirochaetaceae bacterium]
MQTVEYRDRLLPDLARLANRHLGLLTPGWELTERQLASVLRDPLQYGPYFREEPRPGTTETMCVMDRERLVAAAALWLPERSDPRWSDGRLRGDGRDEAELLWLLSDPESEGGLRTLLEAACRRAARLGCRRITAGDVCSVCPARYGVPASWTHLGAGLEDRGFEVTSQSAMMHARLTDLHDGPPADIDGLTLEWREDPEVPEWELLARLGGRQVGECLAWGLSRHVADHPEYRRWMMVEWIEVAESHRRRGIGRRLVREQMRAHAERGGTDALLQVFLPDPDAARFHEAMGFSVIETGSTYRKDGL